MKKRWTIIAMAALAMLFSACQAEQGSRFAEVLPAGQQLFRYEGTEGTNAIAVDGDGLLYTAFCILPEYTGPVLELEYVQRFATQRFHVYDLEGNCILEQDVEMGNGPIEVMAEEQGKLYCIISKSTLDYYGHAMYAVDTETWEVEELCELSGFFDVQGFVHIGEFFYVIGQLEYPEAKSYSLPPDVYVYEYAGEVVCRVNPFAEQPVLEQLPVDFPISIFGTEKDTLIIYHYADEYGFGFYEFSPREQTLVEAGRQPRVINNTMFTMCEDGYLFLEGGILYFGTLDGAEAELTEDGVWLLEPPVYKKGFAFYINYEADGTVERICVANLLKENRTIHLLMHIDTQDKPFGCGYRMERTVLETEQYALKILAQDTDFDIFVLSTRNNSAYNLKENGAFYALDEVDGVQEYLDACFPYIKELATNEDGEIWMVPVRLAIPMLFYHKEYCAAMGVDLTEMNLMDFLCFTEQAVGMDTEREKVDISSYLLREELFGQYMQIGDTFDTPLLKDYLRKMKEIYDRDGLWSSNFYASEKVNRGEPVDFYYFYNLYQAEYPLLLQAIGSSEWLDAIGMPKMAEGIGNVGILTFLAVNPQAENLDAALDYISSFAKYMMEQKDSFMLADKATYTDTPLAHDIYEVYANGAVRFAMDSSVFDEQYYSYMAGRMTLEEMIEESERRRKIYLGE